MVVRRLQEDIGKQIMKSLGNYFAWHFLGVIQTAAVLFAGSINWKYINFLFFKNTRNE